VAQLTRNSRGIIYDVYTTGVTYLNRHNMLIVQANEMNLSTFLANRHFGGLTPGGLPSHKIDKHVITNLDPLRRTQIRN
jgi:hypothetical protein